MPPHVRVPITLPILFALKLHGNKSPSEAEYLLISNTFGPTSVVVNAQRSQLLTVMADAVSECRTATDQAAELNETGQVGLLRLAEIWSAIRAKEGMGGLILEGTEAKILSEVVAQFYAYLSGCMFNDPVGMAIYAELHYMMSSLMLGEWFE